MTRPLLARLTALGVLAGLLVLVPGVVTTASAGTRVFPVPTSSAGLGRIVTARDGTMWFAEREAHKVGRITPSGRITEIAIPAEFPGTSLVKDLDVAPDGTVWVLYDSGERIRHLSASGATLADGQLDSSGYPYGEQVRVARNGTVWVTMSYDEDYVVRIVGTTIYRHPNAPGCDDALGLGRDGTAWCRQDDGLVKIAADGSGGVRYPAGRYAAYPYTIAAGAVGSIWFGRYFEGTIYTSPDDGEVGYLNASTGRTKMFNTGSRTAPSDLVKAPDGSMWFTSTGAAAGIGHLTTRGKGALTAIGGYEPAHLTFAKDGSIFATDPTNNVILRVSTAQLQRTNVRPGAGSVFTRANATVTGRVVRPRTPAAVRKARVPVTVACPARGAVCRGRITLRTVRKGHAVVARTAAYAVRPGKHKTVRVALTARGKRLVRGHRVTPLRVTLSAQGARTSLAVVKVRR